jgi:hypothetical protein
MSALGAALAAAAGPARRHVPLRDPDTGLIPAAGVTGVSPPPASIGADAVVADGDPCRSGDLLAGASGAVLRPVLRCGWPVPRARPVTAHHNQLRRGLAANLRREISAPGRR